MLIIAGRELKLSKCYNALHECKWKDVRCIPKLDTNFKLSMQVGNLRRKIVCLKINQIRVLIGVPINLSHQIK